MKPYKKKKSKYDRMIKVMSIVMVTILLIGLVSSLFLTFSYYLN